MQAIVLAAGYATRLYPLTKDFPKALLSVGGKPMLDHLVEELDLLDELTDIHVISNHRFYPHFVQWAQTHKVRKLRIHDDGTSDDDNKLGAIGDIDFVMKTANIHEDCLIVAGDNFLRIDLNAFVQAYHAHPDAALLLSQRIKDMEVLRRFGVAQAATDGRVLSLEEKPAQPKSDLGVFALYAYPKEVMALIPQYLQEGNSPDAPGHFPAWLLKEDHAKVYTFITEMPCYDIGTHASLKLVRSLYGE